MPKQYEAIRDKSVVEGMSYDAAQAKAARIYNAKHPNNPVGPHSDKKHKKTKKPKHGAVLRSHRM